MGVFRVRLNRSAQSGSARQVLQSLQGVGQTRVMGDMVHMVESCVNDFWALSTVLATRHSSLNLSLRHEVARLIVWHAVSTRMESKDGVRAASRQWIAAQRSPHRTRSRIGRQRGTLQSFSNGPPAG